MQKNWDKKKNKNQKTVKKEIKNPKTLIIVDAQNDFCDPSGALYVNGAENIVQPIIDYVKKNKDSINQIIFTRDWHLKKDKSFKKNGGQWEPHCIQNTEGAELNKELFSELVKMKIPINIVNKGCVYDHEEYGAFERMSTFHHLYPNEAPIVQHCYFANVDSSSGARIINEDLVICGVAGDYCVKETIKNLKGHWKKFNITLLMDAIASIDDGSTLLSLIDEMQLKTI